MPDTSPPPHPTPRADPHPGDVDLVGGNPPVPISVWRTAHTPADTGQLIPARLAYRVVAAYTRPGEIIIDLTADHALTTPAHAGGRRHHPAWLTDVATLTIGPASPAAPSDAAGHDDTLDWFGDDLAGPHPPTPAEPSDGDLDTDGDPAGRTSLLAASYPLDPSPAAHRVALAALLTVGRRTLRPGGSLLLIAHGTGRPAPEDFSPVIAAAAAHRFGYLQHIVAVTAGTDGDQFTFYPTDQELLALTEGRHVPIHTDLLVFTHRPYPGDEDDD